MKNSSRLFIVSAVFSAVGIWVLSNTGNVDMTLAAFTSAFIIGGSICDAIENLPELLVAEDISKEESTDA